MNKGQLPGLNQDGWRNYPLEVRTLGPGGSGNAQPTLGYTTVSNFARYIIIDHRYVTVEVMVTFLTNCGIGDLYVIKLPFPANRWTGARQPSAVPLSSTPGMAYWSFSDPWLTVPVVATLADPHVDLGSEEDSWFQMYCGRVLGFGTSVETGGTKAVSPLNFSPRLSPSPQDIEVVFTDALSIGSTSGPPAITATGSSTFTVTNSGGGSGAAHFSYRVQADPPAGQYGAVVGPNMPWDWTPGGTFGAFGNLFLQLSYEAKF